MRNRWEGAADLDEPATITERQLRSLRRGARAGVLAILLALVATVAAGWSVLMGPDALAGIEGVQDVKHKVLAAIGQPPAENDRVPAPATNSTPSKSTVQDSSASRLNASNGR
ncbi:MAG: hypothetical protein E6K77_06885 [Candidatus Eisenbacteria bacterium]|uniref:Uncharacterized protein n=1 Tax=Eiseniibacteriota bacterium TaxID=2212470 RepID=A0A538TG28_UNCEI|nr:MAG: hypothetical protein E6K77_06885 [Candidatus Eisenbacteria bacterium]